MQSVIFGAGSTFTFHFTDEESGAQRVNNSLGLCIISRLLNCWLWALTKLKRESEPSKEFGGEMADGTRQKSTFELGETETKMFKLRLLEQMKNDLKFRMH